MMVDPHCEFTLMREQSVFLGDITAAYHKNPELESLLFDDFFIKGRQCLYIAPVT